MCIFISLGDDGKDSLGLLVVIGPGLKFLTRVRSAIYGLGLNLENFTLKM